MNHISTGLTVLLLLVVSAAHAEPKVKAVSLGQAATCAIGVHGKVHCWNAYESFVDLAPTTDELVGVPKPKGGLGVVQQLAIGYHFACARDVSGTVRCWGNNDEGALGLGHLDVSPRAKNEKHQPVVGSHRFVDISAGYNHACGVTTAGRVLCWGANQEGQSGTGAETKLKPEPVKVGKALRAHCKENYSCALSTTGKVTCWGNVFGFAKPVAPTPVNLPPVTQLALDQGHACALDKRMQLHCWGDTSGLVKNAPNIDKAVRIPLPPMHGKTVVAITAAPCIVQSDGRAACKGSLGARLARKEELAPDAWATISAPHIHGLATNNDHGCFLTPGQHLRCFGARDRLGSGYEAEVSRPVAVLNLRNAKQIAAHGHHTCVVDDRSGVRCWGGDRNGLAVPKRVAGIGAKVKTLALATGATCALRIDGNIACWGVNEERVLGRGKATNQYGPPVGPGLVQGLAGPALALDAGDHHACAVVQVGGGSAVQCWGASAKGQSGLLPQLQYPPPLIPSDVVGAGGATAVGCGSCASCISKKDQLMCWGCNEYGTVGNGRLAKRERPTVVVGGRPAVQLAISGGAACARTSGGEVYCWGAGALTPVRWHGIGTAVHLSAGGQEGACVTNASGKVHCGLPNAHRLMPVPPALAVAQGDDHACALLKNGSVRCWGKRQFCALGDGVPDYVLLPSRLAW